MAREAERCLNSYPRWHWLGKQGHAEARRRIAVSHLLVVS